MMRALFLFLVLTLPAPALVPMMVPALPCNLVGRVLWLDDSDSTTLTFNGSNVSAWSDKSGHGNGCANGTASTQPTYNATAINGHPGVVFSYSGQQFLGNTSLNIAQPTTIFVIGNVSSYITDYEIAFDGANPSDRNAVLLAYGSNAPGLYAGNVLAGGSSSLSPALFEAVFNGGSSAFYVNGSMVASGSSGADNLSNGYQLGQGWNESSPGQWWNGPLGEILVAVGVVPSSASNQLHYYFHRKWGMP